MADYVAYVPSGYKNMDGTYQRYFEKTFNSLDTDKNLEDARKYAKSLLAQTYEGGITVTDNYPNVITEVEIEDTRYDFRYPETRNFYTETHVINFDGDITENHIIAVHNSLENYYEDGRNYPLDYHMKDGKAREVLDMYPLFIGKSWEKYIIVKTVIDGYDWDQGVPDLSKSIVYVYNAKSKKGRKLLADLYTMA